jgi:CBS domain-containing protein
MKQWQVRDVMTTDVAAVREDTAYREIVDVLAARRVSAVPVVDSVDRVLGVVSEADLIHKIEFAGAPHENHLFEARRVRAGRAKANGDTARELMTTPAVTVLPHTSLARAARIMDAENVKQLPVINDLGRLVGIVARSDLLKVHLRADADVTADVNSEVLTGTPGLEPGSVAASVAEGVVTLTGRVDRSSTATLAVRLTRAVPGVVDVVDHLGYDFDDTDLVRDRSFRSHPFTGYPIGM